MGQGAGACCTAGVGAEDEVLPSPERRSHLGVTFDLPSLLKDGAQDVKIKGRADSTEGPATLVIQTALDDDEEHELSTREHSGSVDSPSRTSRPPLSTVGSLPKLQDEFGRERIFSEDEENLLRCAQRKWTLKQAEADRARRTREFDDLLEQTKTQQMMAAASIISMPANRYGEHARLPLFQVGVHVPVLALINPFAGAMAGADILACARATPYYQGRFFNIIDVVRDQRRGGLLDLFRVELCKARDEAKAMGVRPRLISGGGDGTASFALFMLFSALRADELADIEGWPDRGNGFIWSDDELRDYFPALAQMPLGSANDFGHTLGWGQRYPGDVESRCFVGSRAKALESLRTWISSVTARETRIANFDVFGIMPQPGEEACDFKLAELTGQRGFNPKVNIEGEEQLLMKEAGLPVPLFVCLYFSAGFCAYMTARFQMNRRRTPVQNKMEYARQALGIVAERVPPQLNVGLESVRVTCKENGEDATYFPPRASDGNTGRKYREVGFLNINWQAGMANGADRAPVCGRICSTREPAKFNDGKVDMYRLRFRSGLKNPGMNIQTDKRDNGMTLEFNGDRGTGIFFQWDGEARFAFSPTGQPFHINVRKILNIPVVLGPHYDPRITGNPDNGLPVTFGFCGETLAEQEATRNRILRGVRGELNSELIGSASDMEAVGLPCEGPR